jgi:hypothetical protein
MINKFLLNRIVQENKKLILKKIILFVIIVNVVKMQLITIRFIQS